jgi:hypothetical protein
MGAWVPLLAGPVLLVGVLAGGWFAVSAVVMALVSWPALIGVALLGVLAARAATDPTRTHDNS